jgi:hypothetical protein
VVVAGGEVRSVRNQDVVYSAWGGTETWGRTRVGDQHSTPLNSNPDPFYGVVSLVLITQAVEYDSIPMAL